MMQSMGVKWSGVEMIQRSQLVREHILDFDDDFERTLRRNRNQPDHNQPIPKPDLAEQVLEEEEEPTAQEEEQQQEMAVDNQTIKELSALGLNNVMPLCIQYPRAAQDKTDEFEFKSSLLHHIPKFHGLSMEDPNKRAFPFSVLDKAKDWLYELAPGAITSWESMKRAFLEKFFLNSRVILLRKRISGIQQNQDESFPTSYECFKTLIASCPRHQMKEELFLQYFYEGLLPIERQMLGASAGGALVDKTPMAAKTLITNRALNAEQYEGIGQKDSPRQQVNEGQENQAKVMQNQDKRVDQLEKQIRQIAEFVGQFRDQGKLPSSTIANPKGGYKEDEMLQMEEEESTQPTARVETPLPFMQTKRDEAEKDILETFRKVQVNIPLLDAIKQVPRYAKFLKELCTTRKRISNKEVVKRFSILETWREPRSTHTNKVEEARKEARLKDFKEQRAWRWSILGLKSRSRDLGPSINVMPYSVYASMNLGELKNDGMIIQLADRSNAYPKGVLEDVLVQVNQLIFPVDFYVLDMENSDRSPTLPTFLGRPFMKTARTKIDVFKGTLTMEFDGEVIDFNISETMRYPSDNHSCFSIDILDSLAQEYLEELNDNALETIITRGMELNNKGATPMLTHGTLEEFHAIPPYEEFIKMVAALESLPKDDGKPSNFESIPVSTNKILPSVIQAPTPELKPLPSHLKYVFLGEQETLPVIVSSSLTAQEEDKLVRVLKEFKSVIGWTLADIKGISHTTCMHHIFLEEGAKPTRVVQGRLNPPMMEVVKNEIIKLLDCGVIYPISDSHWVSPIQVVPKKFRIAVMKNEENELVPTRILTDWRVCIDYRKLNATTGNDHFPLPFIDQMLERLAGHSFYCFLGGYSGFYTRFFKDFSKLAKPFCRLLQKDASFDFNEACEEAFKHLKTLLTSAPIITPPDWSIPFELMCDASDYAIGAVLGKRKNKQPHVIYYASRTLNDA
ncbi:unnamed protein product [Malus baccata var. baccata]